MTEIDQYMILRYGVIAIGLILLYSAVQGLRTGETRGYYADHIYSRASNRGSFYLWISLRGILALISLSFGLLA